MEQNNNHVAKTQNSLFETFKTSNTTVTELRVGIFAPISKTTTNSVIYKHFVKNNRKRQIDTPWGSVKIKGNILTQVHKDIIDAIFATATFSEKTKGGNIALFFSAYAVQEFLGKKTKCNNKWLKSKLDEIKTTNIEYTDKSGNSFDFNLTDSGGFSVKKDAFVIVFTEGYQNFFQSQVSVDYKNELKELIKVDEPLIKSVVRFFFSHANNMQIDFINLLNTLGYPTEIDQSMKKARRIFRLYTDELAKFNITFNDKTWLISYKKIDSVFHNVPKAPKIVI